MKTYLVTNPPTLDLTDTGEPGKNAVLFVSIGDVIRNPPKVRHCTDNSDDWSFETDELIRQLVWKERSLDDPPFQATLLD